MNESNIKKILFNRSTLLSLKAELMKKQEEVKEKKRMPQNQIENFKPPPAQKKENSSDTIEKKSFKDSLKAIDTEELEACKKSKAALEKKAELYEHLSDSIGTSHLTNQYLVDFNSKKQEESMRSKSPENILYDDDSEWTEYTDCLGRSRKCLKSDLDVYKKRDKELLKSLGKEVPSDDNTSDVQSVEATPETTELVKTTKDYLQSLREKWEQKEHELLSKEGDIHYQDVLFDEARVHGVGYFAFSTDDAERQKQMGDLKRTHEETLMAQKEAEALRKKRDDLIAARVSAARARQRLRAGLPLEDPEEKKKSFEECLLKFLNEQRNEAENKAKEEENRLKEEKEKEREKLRKEYIRQWDLGKEGVNGRKKEKFRELSQEEYVEQQRAKRIKEFAPLDNRKSNANTSFNSKGEIGAESSQKTWSDVRPVVDNVDTTTEQNEPKGLYFSSKTKYDYFVQGPTLIVNELDQQQNISNEKVLKRRVTDHAEIPPPLTFEYNCPTTKKSKPDIPISTDMQEAYAQGLKQLQKKESKSNICEKYTFIS